MFRWMSYGRLSIIKEISSGYGLNWMPKLGKLLVYIGSIVARYQKSALWNSMPPVYRQCAVIYTDPWSAYDSVLPSKRHHSVDFVVINE